MKINFENREEILKQLGKVSCVKFTIKAAKLVSHLSSDPRTETAIQAAEAWVKDPSEDNRVAANAAGWAANAAGIAGWAAYAAGYAAWAAAGYNADDAANAAGWAAGDAIYAADVVDPEEIKQQLTQYLKELYLDSLPEEERNCWLVQAAVGV